MNEVVDGISERMVWYEVRVFKQFPRGRGRLLVLKPVKDGVSLVRESVQECHRVAHWQVGNGAVDGAGEVGRSIKFLGFVRVPGSMIYVYPGRWWNDGRIGLDSWRRLSHESSHESSHPPHHMRCLSRAIIFS